MTPDDTTVGQEPITPAGQEPTDNDAAKLRAEAAKWRTQFRASEAERESLKAAADELAALKASQKSDAEKLADQVAALNAQLAAAQAQALAAEKARHLTALAAKAGVPLDVVSLLDVTKFDLEDEDATVKALAALAPRQAAPQAGAPSNPGRNGSGGMTDIAAFMRGGTTAADIFSPNRS